MAFLKGFFIQYLRSIITTWQMLQLYYSATKMILMSKQMNYGLALDIAIFILGRYVCH